MTGVCVSACVGVLVCVHVCVCESDSECVCVCVSQCVCESVSVCVCVCERLVLGYSCRYWCMGVTVMVNE